MEVGEGMGSGTVRANSRMEVTSVAAGSWVRLTDWRGPQARATLGAVVQRQATLAVETKTVCFLLEAQVLQEVVY